MEKIYSPYKGKTLNRSSIDSIRKNDDEINGIISKIIAEKYHNDKKAELSGSDQIIRDILMTYVHLILKHDASFEPIAISDLEKWISSDLEIVYDNNKINIKAGGIIDRIDYSGGINRIIDYKTGTVEMEIDTIESLFDESYERRNEAWFQVLMYCELFVRENPEVKVIPSLYPVRKLTDAGFSDHLVIKKWKEEKVSVTDYSEIRNDYLSHLKLSIESIFSKNEPFMMTEHRRKCEICPYRQLCQR
jgi:CRISPR/Cas system-associated exonuclease Cas4 (RecB family)